MFTRAFIIFVGVVFLKSSLAFADPISWQDLSQHFMSSVSYRGELRPHFSDNVEWFFKNFVDKDRNQLLFVENISGSHDTILDFAAFRCYGILKRLIPRHHPNRDKLLQNTSEHIFHQIIVRLDALSYPELCHVIHESLQGKYNLFHVLIDNGLFAARNRLLYFLIDKTFRHFEAINTQETQYSPSLSRLLNMILLDRKIQLAMQGEHRAMLDPLVDSWEDIADLQIENFVDESFDRRYQANFLGQLLHISRNLLSH